VCCPSLKSIFIPASVSVLDGAAFAESSIEEIVVDTENPNFGTSGPFLVALDGLILIRYFGSGENTILHAESEFWTLNTGDRLKRIGPYAFSENSFLKSICIPASIEVIGEVSFRECTSMSQLTFEPGSRLTRIGEYAICDCTSLISICIPAEVEEIPEGCLSECHSLEECLFESGSKLFRIHERAFENCQSLRRLVIPAQLQIMDFGALLGCEPLRELIFETPSNLKQLDLPGSDFGCLCIPDSVESVCGNIRNLADQNRVLEFGRASNLNEINLKLCQRSQFSWIDVPGNKVFVRLSEEVMRKFRSKFEEL
jgi:hypothetical protein